MYQYNATITRVVDGDTVHARVDLGFDTHVDATLRLLGVNAPEKRDAGGHDATEWLRSKVLNMVVRIETVKDRREKYGRYLATLYVQGEIDSVNQQLVAAGHAVEYAPGGA